MFVVRIQFGEIIPPFPITQVFLSCINALGCIIVSLGYNPDFNAFSTTVRLINGFPIATIKG